MDPVDRPDSAVMSAIDVRSKPLRLKQRTAASVIWLRRSSLRASVSRGITPPTKRVRVLLVKHTNRTMVLFIGSSRATRAVDTGDGDSDSGGTDQCSADSADEAEEGAEGDSVRRSPRGGGHRTGRGTF